LPATAAHQQQHQQAKAGAKARVRLLLLHQQLLCLPAMM
jgi:hypothetical protein